MSKILKIILVILGLWLLLFIALFAANLPVKTEGDNNTKTENISTASVNEEEDSNRVPDLREAEKEKQKKLLKDKDKGLFILVNKENSVAENYEPEDLLQVSYFAANRSPEGRKMRSEAAAAFDEMAEAARKEGIIIVATTAYRSFGFQTILYNNYVKNYGKEEADKFSAMPGYSEHQTGLAIDVSSPSVNYELVTAYENTQEGKWLNDNAYKFGFIIRYLKGREDITGYMFEPWHLRYVGKTAAEDIKMSETTLEEYIKEVIEKL